jgi:hypothetical protein
MHGAARGETKMESLITFAGVTVMTLVALFAALALESLLLKATFVLMAPAASNRTNPVPVAARRNTRVPVEQGARLLAEAYEKTR